MYLVVAKILAEGKYRPLLIVPTFAIGIKVKEEINNTSPGRYGLIETSEYPDVPYYLEYSWHFNGTR